MTTIGSDPSSAALPVDLEQLAASGSYASAVHQLLTVVRTQLGMQVAWVSEFVGGDQVLRYVDSAPGCHAPAQGTRLPLGGSFCSRVLDGRFPALIPDARRVPEAVLLDVTAELHIGSYVGVPLVGPSGTASGMLCAISGASAPQLGERDVASLKVLAGLLDDLQHRAVDQDRAALERQQVLDALARVIEGHDRHAVLQPIVDLTTGRAVAAEGLTRFTARSAVGNVERAPAQWFDDASRLGLCSELEVATARSVLERLDEVPPHVALTVNLAPDTLLAGHLEHLVHDLPVDRVVVEITEHAPVSDYDELERVLRPYRQAGLKVAVDDAGAGYASLRHVLAVQPDLVKVDMALIRGLDADLARLTLLTALADFARASRCRLVAEGVETGAELRAVRSCGVPLVQGYLLARPSATPQWDGFAVA